MASARMLKISMFILLVFCFLPVGPAQSAMQTVETDIYPNSSFGFCANFHYRIEATITKKRGQLPCSVNMVVAKTGGETYFNKSGQLDEQNPVIEWVYERSNREPLVDVLAIIKNTGSCILHVNIKKIK